MMTLGDLVGAQHSEYNEVTVQAASRFRFLRFSGI